MKKTIRKTILTILVFTEIMMLNIYPVQAFLGTHAPNANDMLEKMEKRFQEVRDR